MIKLRINIPMVRNNDLSDRNMISKLKPGDKLRAKVLEIKGDLVRLELRSGEVVYGKSEIPLDFSNEKFMSFIIKEMGDNILSLVPDYDSIDLNDNYTIKNERLIMNKVLEFLGLEKSDENIELVKNMVKFNMPLDSETVQENIKYVDKLLSLLETGSDEEVYVLSKEINPLKEDVAKLLKLPKQEVLEKAVNLVESFEEVDYKEINYDRDKVMALNKSEEVSQTAKGGLESAEKGDINRLKNLINALDKDIKEKIQGNPVDMEMSEGELTKLERALYKDVTGEVKSEIQKLFPEGKLSEQDIQKIVFLNRAEVKISIENLNNLDRFLSGENISDDLESILDLAIGEKLISPEEKARFQSMAASIKLEFKEDGADGIKNYNKNVNELLHEVSEKLSQLQPRGEEITRQVVNLNDKLEMFNKINEKALFMFVPLNIDRGEVKDKLYFMSKRRHGNQSETIRAYIALETKNLDKVSALCDYRYGRLDVSFKVAKDKVAVFSKTKDALRSALSGVGYSDVTINIKEDLQENVLDMMSDDSSINYMINIKV